MTKNGSQDLQDKREELLLRIKRKGLCLKGSMVSFRVLFDMRFDVLLFFSET